MDRVRRVVPGADVSVLLRVMDQSGGPRMFIKVVLVELLVMALVFSVLSHLLRDNLGDAAGIQFLDGIGLR